MIVYCGKKRFGSTAEPTAYRNGRELPRSPSERRVLYSAHGWDWGKESPQAKQLAFALLLDALKSPRHAHQWHEEFESQLMRGWGSMWVMTDSEIAAWWTVARRTLPERKNADAPETAAD